MILYLTRGEGGKKKLWMSYKYRPLVGSCSPASSAEYFHLSNSAGANGWLETNSSRKTLSCFPNLSLRPVFVRDLPML